VNIPTTVPVGTPSPTLAVIGAGLGRTGTLSLHAALERLGFAPCDHMTNNFNNPARFSLWLEAIHRKRAEEPIDWRPLFAGYRATLDWPGVFFWRELTAAHPETKVILTVRDPERWYESARATIYAASQARDDDLATRMIANVLTWLDPRAGHGFRVVQETVWDGTFGGQFADREAALGIFAEHNREVQKTIPQDQLLVFDVKQGWEPLCAFLGVPVPDGEPFPHVNDVADFSRRQQGQYMRLARAVAPAMGFAVVGGLLALALRWRQDRPTGCG
jgi:hypothetical protein